MFHCHRLPERSLYFRGKPLPICARCTGIIVGYVLALIMLVLGYKINLLHVVLLMIPLVVDGFLQAAGVWESTNTRRLITGSMAGVAMIYFLVLCAITGFNHGQSIGNYFFN